MLSEPLLEFVFPNFVLFAPFVVMSAFSLLVAAQPRWDLRGEITFCFG